MSATWQWAKANPDAAARRIRDLERENATLRADLLIEEERSIYWRDNEGKAMAENAALREDKERLREQLREANRLLVAFAPESARAAIDATKPRVGDDAIMRQHLNEGGTPT